MSGIWREDSNAEWVLTDLLDKLADKKREGEEGSEHSRNIRQGKTCRQAGMGERPQSPVQDGRLPEPWRQRSWRPVVSSGGLTLHTRDVTGTAQA